MWEFTEANPTCLSRDIFQEGCHVVLCSDGELLFVQFNVPHPAIQMRLLMRGLTMYIDPTGKRKEKYSVVFPSAKEVQDKMQPMPQPESAELQDIGRPDISPLLDALIEYGTLFDEKGKSMSIRQDMFSISIDGDDDVLSYSVLIPIGRMLMEKKLSEEWSIGMYSQGNGGMNIAPTNGNDAESLQRPVDDDLRDTLNRDIETWTTFSFPYICTLND